MKQKLFKIIDSTLVQYQNSNATQNPNTTDPTTSMVTTTTVTGYGFRTKAKR